MDFDDFGYFCKDPVHDFSQELTLLERSFSVFVIFTEFSLPERVLERSLRVFVKFAVHFRVIFEFCVDLRDFAQFWPDFDASSTRPLSAFAIFDVPKWSIFMDFNDFGNFWKGPVHDFSQ